MKTAISRRTLLQSAICAATILPALGLHPSRAEAAALAPLDPADPSAKALGYVTNTAKVDAAANPTHKPDQTCGNCAQFQGKPGDAEGGCNIFAGKSVARTGWCKVWAKKPGA
jgi:hypothetical protein